MDKGIRGRTVRDARALINSKEELRFRERALFSFGVATLSSAFASVVFSLNYGLAAFLTSLSKHGLKNEPVMAWAYALDASFNGVYAFFFCFLFSLLPNCIGLYLMVGNLLKKYVTSDIHHDRKLIFRGALYGLIVYCISLSGYILVDPFDTIKGFRHLLNPIYCFVIPSVILSGFFTLTYLRKAMIGLLTKKS